MSFLTLIKNTKIEENLRYHVLHVAKDLDLYLTAGKDPYDALEFLLGFYKAVPNIQAKMQHILAKSLSDYLSLEQRQEGFL